MHHNIIIINAQNVCWKRCGHGLTVWHLFLPCRQKNGHTCLYEIFKVTLTAFFNRIPAYRLQLARDIGTELIHDVTRLYNVRLRRKYLSLSLSDYFSRHFCIFFPPSQSSPTSDTDVRIGTLITALCYLNEKNERVCASTFTCAFFPGCGLAADAKRRRAQSLLLTAFRWNFASSRLGRLLSITVALIRHPAVASQVNPLCRPLIVGALVVVVVAVYDMAVNFVKHYGNVVLRG